jgi:hypothetical protein
MWDKLRDWVKKWLGIKIEDEQSPVDKFVMDYEDVKAENITAQIANKLAMLTFADSTMAVHNSADKKAKKDEPLGRRAQLMEDLLRPLWVNDTGWITAQALGKGGKLLVPVFSDGEIQINTLDQNRMSIQAMKGGNITDATLLIDSVWRDERRYYLLANYALNDGGITIRYKVKTEEGADAELEAVPEWTGITPEISIGNVDRMLFAYIKCPRDNRRDTKKYGVPITYGAETEICDLVEQANIYRREYKLTRPMLGLDSTLWRDPNAKMGDVKPNTIKDVRKNVQDGDDPFIPFEASSIDGKTMWQLYAPPIRYEAMEGRLNSLKREVEKKCGLSQGVLTERQTMNYANRDEVRAAQYDTFSVVKALRDRWTKALDDLAYAIDVLAERFGVTPAGARGQFALIFDWDMSLIESTEQTFSQYSELHAMGAMGNAEIRAWVTGEDIEEARSAIDEIRKIEGESRSALERILSRTDPEDEGADG